MKRKWIVVLGCSIAMFCFTGLAIGAEEACITCHRDISPGQVADWESSKHSEEDVTCSVCHGEEHTNAKDFKKVTLPDEHVCAQCHEEQFDSFVKGKHNHGWTSLNAMPVTHVEPDELMEGGRGCGGCHNMGVKSEAQKKEQRDKGYRYQNNSCDECHTRHSFAKKEAQDPRACQQCHMGYDHPQWEMWSSAKHGTRWFAREAGRLPKNAKAPTCQECHLPNGTHENKTAWGFLGVRLPLPADKQWAADRVTILKALGVLNPETGEPTARLDVVKSVDMVRLTEDAWQTERDKMIKTCSKCHSEDYAREQLAYGDSMLQKADRLLAESIEIVAGLYKDGIIKKPENYAFAYPDFLYFLRTGGGNMDQMSHIDQVLFQMYMKHRMRTYQGNFHVNPDYAYWYGWAMMTKDLGEIKKLAKTMRAAAKIEK
ncbi:MAG: cytochrome C [Deltaproteobacteria bacterium]|nr:cytochrome C [Deltaproteobacteria bacterium]MBW1939006.1 cytochrome C [Deltaproteobacteria bacterium]MBW1964966.1 cytochrome C [Deltaproteobacteria bacterium]MBW2080648.1 cytochrome C [Deltaproteobacteria bacterium]MBW2350589.1 cytochrome C [Deltaproteobacteria bacterium]